MLADKGYDSQAIVDAIKVKEEDMDGYRFRYRLHAQTLYTALCQDPFYATLAKTLNNNCCQERLIMYMDYSMQESEEFGELSISENWKHGASLWLKSISNGKHKEMKRRKKHFIEKYLGPECLEAYNSIVEFMSEKTAPFLSGNEWYLSIVGVSPEYQGQGIGQGLVDVVLQSTDKLGIGTYLETFSPRNISFYERLGYRVAASFLDPTTQSEYALMKRQTLQR
ncbi:GNAT family N-acetyltransferase [Desulfolutivibrio sulfoxidireducens]|uniref:GNAT family N-acetyltransferase n=1 Tax=Desulfolutivibrio sulfoxidireducens TaxID=2773299 RepID=UPI00159DA2A2|nr:GNAT family N-acetyltransferase [Desulfolutivibrio sulfoxidireducens]QLA17152.1 GNAT family N-acetyltransferase [Desulfolutivibrio sulfoxidireducens]